MDGSCDGRALSSAQLQHRLHVLPEERCLDGHLVGQITVDDTCHPFKDMPQLQVSIKKLAQVDHPHGYHLCLAVNHFQQAIAHDVRSWVDTQYNLFHSDCKGTKKTKEKPNKFICFCKLAKDLLILPQFF